MLRLKLILQRFYVKLCKDQPIDVFTTYVYQSFTGFRGRPSIMIWRNFTWFFKNWMLLYRFMELRKESDWFTSLWMLCSGIELFTPKTGEIFCFLRPSYHYYQRCINPAAIKIRKHFYQILLPRVCLKELWFRSNTFSYQCSQCGQQRWYRVYRTCL